MRKSILLIFFMTLTTVIVKAQSAAIYLCNNCTYKNSADGKTITFNKNGTVKLNGKAAPYYKCVNNDGTVDLYYKGKLVNELAFNIKGNECTLIDKRKMCYVLISCKGPK